MGSVTRHPTERTLCVCGNGGGDETVRDGGRRGEDKILTDILTVRLPMSVFFFFFLFFVIYRSFVKSPPGSSYYPQLLRKPCKMSVCLDLLTSCVDMFLNVHIHTHPRPHTLTLNKAFVGVLVNASLSSFDSLVVVAQSFCSVNEEKPLMRTLLISFVAFESSCCER